MPDASQPLNLVQYVAPGFLFVHVLYALGIGRNQTGFDRAAWSLVLSVPIHWLAMQVVAALPPRLTTELTFDMYLLALALLGALLVGLLSRLWSFLFPSPDEESGA